MSAALPCLGDANAGSAILVNISGIMTRQNNFLAVVVMKALLLGVEVFLVGDDPCKLSLKQRRHRFLDLNTERLAA